MNETGRAWERYGSIPCVPDADLWRIDLTRPADDSVLSPDERERAARLRIPEKRHQFVAARAGLRHILTEYADTPPENLIFAVGQYGKPMLATPDNAFIPHTDIHYNVAHSGDWALVVVARQPIGIDLERVRPLDAMGQMIDISFSPEEQAALAALSGNAQTAAFFRTWTRKEAYMKARGQGFKLAKTFTVPITETPDTFDVGGWTVCDVLVIDMAGYVAAVAVEK